MSDSINLRFDGKINLSANLNFTGKKGCIFKKTRHITPLLVDKL